MQQDQSGAKMKYYMSLSDEEEAEPVHHQWKLSAHISPSSIQSACTYPAKHSHPPWHSLDFSLLVHTLQLTTPTLPDTFKSSVCLHVKLAQRGIVL